MEESYLTLDSFVYITGYLDLVGLYSLSLTTTGLYDLIKDKLTIIFIREVMDGQITTELIRSKLRSTSLHFLLSFMTDVSEVNVDKLVSKYTEDERVTLFLAFCMFVQRKLVLGFWLNPGQMKRKDLFNLSRFLFTLGYREKAVYLEYNIAVRCSSLSKVIFGCNIESIMDELIKDLSTNDITYDHMDEYVCMMNTIIEIYQHFSRVYNTDTSLSSEDRGIVGIKLEEISNKCKILSDIIVGSL